jgi:hypothetical protein
VEVFRVVAPDYIRVDLLQLFGYLADLTIANRALVYLGDRSQVGGGTGQEAFLG